MPLFLTFFLSAVAGFAFAGSLVEVFIIISGQRPQFSLAFQNGPMGLVAIPLLLATGPMLMMRRAAWAMVIDTKRLAVPATMVAGAVAWSICTGWLLLTGPQLWSG